MTKPMGYETEDALDRFNRGYVEGHSDGLLGDERHKANSWQPGTPEHDGYEDGYRSGMAELCMAELRRVRHGERA